MAGDSQDPIEPDGWGKQIVKPDLKEFNDLGPAISFLPKTICFWTRRGWQKTKENQ